ncbi:sigma-70 family RNA polymerase sigma factor [Rhodococcoides kyotonense]|nr:sigma-70 family RNA polymerase sigma factor [Rhodococcus kyotonensis]
MSIFEESRPWQNHSLVSPVDECKVAEPSRDESDAFEGISLYLKQIGKVGLLNAQEEVELAKRIEAGLFAGYHLERLHQSGATLPKYLRRDMTWIVRDGHRAKKHLIEANLRLVVSLAKRHQYRGLDLLDLVQHGNIGLIRTVEKFDYKSGHRFSTYATWWIRQAIQRGIANEARMIRLPVHLEETLAKIRRAEAALADSVDGATARSLVSEQVGMTECDVLSLKNAARKVFSLEWLVYETDGHYSDLFDDEEVEAVDAVTRILLLDQLQSVFETLKEREAGIVKLRNGFGLSRPAEHDEVAQVYGVTSERIRQIETKAMQKLRDPSRSQVLRDYL